MQVVADAGLIEDGFADEFDLESSPYTSTIVFLVRKDNPKNIEDWDDLLREDVGVITLNPKTSGGARWNYLAAWYYFESQGQGDVLIAWENEAFLSLEEHPGEYEIVVPSVLILCQPTVALVDEVVDDRGTRDVATEYLQYLYSTEAQKLEAENFYRPSDLDVLSDYISTSGERVITELPADGKWIVDDIALTDIAHFGGWSEASAKHFADGGVFDAIYEQ